jgi:hypothetical protein
MAGLIGLGNAAEWMQDPAKKGVTEGLKAC